jgi:multiple sugar transport system substrate-binding protein
MKRANRLSRRQVLKSGATGLALTSAIGIAPRFLRQAWAADGLAPGMIGGPTGFPGAENYQYSGDMSEGRAIEGIKKLKSAGKAPSKIVMMMDDGAIGQLNRPWPPGAPTVQSTWEKETGIAIEIVGVPSGKDFPKIMQDVTTKTAGFDIYSFAWNSVGDLVEAGGIADLDEYFDKYQPDFADPKRGYTGGERGVELLDMYAGKHYCVSLDGDFQCWYFRRDLLEDAAEQKNFRARYGRDLEYPKTWSDLDQMSEFFTRPDKGLVGCTDLRNQGWGYTNWYQRYCSMAAPDQYLFDENAGPLINSEAGIKATREYVNALKWHSKDALTWGWPEQYGNFASGGAAMTCAFSNLPKFLDSPANKASKIVGKIRSAVPPGRMHGNDLVRRGVLWYNITAGVSTQAKYPEASYLLLQYLGSTRVFTWMCSNPGGYFDPFQLANFEDHYVQQSYKPYHVPVIRETIKRSVPSLNFAGTSSFHNALDENLMAALAGSKTAEQAMADTANEWKKIVHRQGNDTLANAIRKKRSAWPTLTDKA